MTLSINAQIDSVLFNKAMLIFSKDFGLTVGEQLIYSKDGISRSRISDYRGLGFKIIQTNTFSEYYYAYRDDAWHHDGFWYEINFDTLTKSTYHFVNREHDDSLGFYTEKQAYRIEYIESNVMQFIDSIIVRTSGKNLAVYKFKTEHFVDDTNKVCMLHFISPEYGLIARQSNRWYCVMKSLDKILEGPEEFIFCPYKDRNHFSILNLTDRYELKEKGGETIKVEKENWIIRTLRMGNPVNQTILDFYNDTISCNCNFDELLRGHYEEFAKEPNEGKLTQKQINKIGRRDMRYYRRQERRDKQY